jgi:hypothetical protein
MHAYLKYGLAIGGGLFALKLFNDSKALTAALRDRAMTPKPTTNIGGSELPVPVNSEPAPEKGPTNDEAGLYNDNPNTSYGNGYM